MGNGANENTAVTAVMRTKVKSNRVEMWLAGTVIPCE